ncbi:Restriction endonuclease [Rhizobiales bacterium GAS191]|nr:Restriction endonuclease [Rhizobiales bacterium GAS191]
MSYFSRGQQHWAIFPSREVAITAATGACRWDVGGYDNVTIHPVGAAAVRTKQYDGAADWLFEGEDVWDEPLEQTGVAGIVRRFMRELARRIAAHPRELAAVEWRDLERLLFEVFDALGYEANLTRPAKDGGYDLRLEAEGSVYFVEVKHWSKPSKVGAGIINRFTEIVAKNGGEGLLLSSSGFTDEVIKGRLEVSEYPVVLGSEPKVISLCRYYVQTEAGLWVRESGLRDIFFEGAF